MTFYSKTYLIPLLLLLLLESCQDSQQNKHNLKLTELSEIEYPDNPDIGFCSQEYKSDYFKTGSLIALKEDFHFKLTLISKSGDSIIFNKINLNELIPTVPKFVRNDQYLSFLSIVNQEWNRNQVQFSQKHFQANNSKIVRIDIARNCLNAYLWEVIVYVQENNKVLPVYHTWFDFPKDLYAELFKKKNKIEINSFLPYLENWKNPKSQTVNLSKYLQKYKSRKSSFIDLSDEMYPLAGARLKKRKEIIFPVEFSSMRDLQSDSTLFATFSIPGFYNRKYPRKTELGRINKLLKVLVLENNSSQKILVEFTFLDKEEKRTTKLFLGGINKDDLPTLKNSEANSGWKNSMGFGNHTFYEKYEDHLKSKTSESDYFAYLSDEKNAWLDSHQIGIDGPIIYLDAKDKNILHVWLLSFERHALVGHYQINLK
jgi:hypothetical protein